MSSVVRCAATNVTAEIAQVCDPLAGSVMWGRCTNGSDVIQARKPEPADRNLFNFAASYRHWASHMHGGPDPAGIAEDAHVALDLARTAGRLFGVVGEFYRGPPID